MQRITIYGICIVCWLSTIRLSAQPPVKKLLVHTRFDTVDISNEYILAFYKSHGKLVSDTILHRSHREGDDKDGRISIGLDGDEIFYDRYLFTSVGLLIDLQEKKVLKELSAADLLGEKDRKLYFNNTLFNTKLDLYVYDLDARTYSQLFTRPFEDFYINPHLSSPDYDYFLAEEGDSHASKRIFLVDKKGNRKLLVTASSAFPPLYSGSKARGNTSKLIRWTDNLHFIYPTYTIHNRGGGWSDKTNTNSSDTDAVFSLIAHDSLPCCSINWEEVDIRNGRQRHITTINGIYAPLLDDKIYPGRNSFLFRNYGFDTAQLFQVDLLSGKTEPYHRGPDLFTIGRTDKLMNEEENHPSAVLFKQDTIGKFFVLRATYDDSTVAIIGSSGRDEPNRIFIWSIDNRQWQSLPVNNFLGFLGWINKKDDEHE